MISAWLRRIFAPAAPSPDDVRDAMVLSRREALAAMLVVAPAVAVPRRVYSFLWAPPALQVFDVAEMSKALKRVYSADKIRALAYHPAHATIAAVDRHRGIITLAPMVVTAGEHDEYTMSITGLRDVDAMNFETGARVTLT